MSRRARNQTEAFLLHELTKGAEHVATNLLQGSYSFLIKTSPVIGERGEPVLALLMKMRARFRTGAQTMIQERLKFRLQKWTSQLFTQYRRETNSEGKLNMPRR